MTEPSPEIEGRKADSPEGEPDALRVTLSAFEGPLDLLLHLVRINEIEITDIPIVEITEQYNQYLECMRELKLEIAGEYLLMAATLMHIKSRMLLPPDPDGLEEEEATDPRAELTQQLIEYQRFKQAAENLEALQSRRTLIWTRESIPPEFEGEELLTVDMYDLLGAFRKLLGRLGEEARLRFRREEVSVADKMKWITAALEDRARLDLLEVLQEQPTRLDRIAVFLAVLELMRMQKIVAFQAKALETIHVARRDSVEPAPVSREQEGESGE